MASVNPGFCLCSLSVPPKRKPIIIPLDSEALNYLSCATPAQLLQGGWRQRQWYGFSSHPLQKTGYLAVFTSALSVCWISHLEGKLVLLC